MLRRDQWLRWTGPSWAPAQREKAALVPLTDHAARGAKTSIQGTLGDDVLSAAMQEPDCPVNRCYYFFASSKERISASDKRSLMPASCSNLSGVMVTTLLPRPSMRPMSTWTD